MPLCCDVLLFGTAMLLTRLFVRVHVPCGWCLASAAIVATIFAACSVAVHRSAGAVARRIVGALAMSSAYGVLLLSTGAQVEEAGALQESSVDAFVVTKAQVASLDEAISYVVKSGKPTLLLAFDRECARCELLAAVLFDMERAGRFRGLSWITVRARNDVPHLRRIARTLPIVALVNDRGVVANVIEGDISRADVEALLVHARR
jgi:hypothetical protein